MTNLDDNSVLVQPSSSSNDELVTISNLMEQELCPWACRVVERRKKKACPKVISAKKNLDRNKKTPSTVHEADKKHAISFIPKELLLVARFL